jgi:hypothetical protein
MFARGIVPLHTPPLLGRKSFAAKPRVSISSKPIEIKGLQLHYFGHLQKTGGRGSYRLVHTPSHLGRNSPRQVPHACPEHLSRAMARPSRKSNYSRTYAIPRGWGGLVIPMRSGANSYQRSVQKCGQAKASPYKETTGELPQFTEHGPRFFPHGAQPGMAAPLGTGHRPLAASTPPCHFHHTVRPRLLRRGFPKRNLLVSPLFRGARPAGMSPFVYRCPDAHD